LPLIAFGFTLLLIVNSMSPYYMVYCSEFGVTLLLFFDDGIHIYAGSEFCDYYLCDLLFSPASTIGGASPKPGNGEGCIRKGIRRKILASAFLF
jgi:hypothetical protein